MTKKKQVIQTTEEEGQVVSRIAEALLAVIGKVPDSEVEQSPDPSDAARKIANAAAAKAAAAAGTLALPVGPLGWATILPEMLAVWRIQAQMVADLAAIHGKKGKVTQEQMLYCLFKHAASQAVRDLVVRVGERYLVKRATLKVLQKVAERIGIKVAQRTISKVVSRWIPVVGALGVGAYAYYDTAQVAKSAVELFQGDISFAGEAPATT